MLRNTQQRPCHPEQLILPKSLPPFAKAAEDTLYEVFPIPEVSTEGIT